MNGSLFRSWSGDPSALKQPLTPAINGLYMSLSLTLEMTCASTYAAENFCCINPRFTSSICELLKGMPGRVANKETDVLLAFSLDRGPPCKVMDILQCPEHADATKLAATVFAYRAHTYGPSTMESTYEAMRERAANMPKLDMNVQFANYAVYPTPADLRHNMSKLQLENISCMLQCPAGQIRQRLMTVYPFRDEVGKVTGRRGKGKAYFSGADLELPSGNYCGYASNYSGSTISVGDSVLVRYQIINGKRRHFSIVSKA